MSPRWAAGVPGSLDGSGKRVRCVVEPPPAGRGEGAQLGSGNNCEHDVALWTTGRVGRVDTGSALP
eukprot:9487631-Pyramimonas_sp.AAC.1